MQNNRSTSRVLQPPGGVSSISLSYNVDDGTPIPVSFSPGKRMRQRSSSPGGEIQSVVQAVRPEKKHSIRVDSSDNRDPPRSTRVQQRDSGRDPGYMRDSLDDMVSVSGMCAIPGLEHHYDNYNAKNKPKGRPSPSAPVDSPKERQKSQPVHSTSTTRDRSDRSQLKNRKGY